MVHDPLMPISLLVKGIGPVIQAHLDVIGTEGMNVVERLRELHWLALTGIDEASQRREQTAQDRAVIEVMTHGLNLYQGLITSTLRGEFDLATYLLRGHFDSAGLLFSLLVDPKAADRYSADRLEGVHGRKLYVEVTRRGKGQVAADALNSDLLNTRKLLDQSSHFGRLHGQLTLQIARDELKTPVGGPRLDPAWAIFYAHASALLELYTLGWASNSGSEIWRAEWIAQFHEANEAANRWLARSEPTEELDG